MHSHISELCHNCGLTLDEETKFCPQCGQKIGPLKSSFLDLCREFFFAVVQLDGKFLRTLSALICRPGFLTREYIEGRRVRYLRPITLAMLFVGVLFILVEWDMSRTPKLSELGIANQEQVNVNLGPGMVVSLSGQQIQELNELSEAEINELLREEGIEPESWFGFLANRALHMLSDEGLVRFQHRLVQIASRSVAALIPMVATLAWVLHRRKKLYFTEATIYALHLHSFLFILLIPTLLLPPGSVMREITPVIVLPLLIWYTLCSLRVAFQNSWLWAIVKTATLLIAQLFMVVLLTAIIAVLAVAST